MRPVALGRRHVESKLLYDHRREVDAERAHVQGRDQRPLQDVVTKLRRPVVVVAIALGLAAPLVSSA